MTLTSCDQLLASEESWRVLAEILPQLVWTTRADGCVDYTNQRFCDYTHATPEQLQGYGWGQFLHPEDAERVLTVRAHAFRTGIPYEVEYRLQEGQTGRYRWFLARAMPVRDEAGHIVRWFGTSTDIDEQKRTEEALRQSQECVNILMSSSIIGIAITEGEQIVNANDTYLRMTGYTREDLREGRINWMQITPPEYLAQTLQAQQELAIQQSTTLYEKEFVRKDGSRLPILAGRVTLPSNSIQTIGFVLDNSARKELERRKDEFIAVASHELRAPLTVLKLQAALLKKRIGRQSMQKSAADLEQMGAQVNNGVRLMEELLDVSRIQTGTLKYAQESVDLGALLREIVETMQQTCPTHTLILHGATQTMFVSDRNRLRQIFINLINNAIKYSPQAKTVEIDLRTTAETVTISVHDHGLGIPPEQREKIFERFYRAAGAREHAIPGLGIGLYLVAEIVSHYGGTIAVDSQVGHGSTFHVTFPRTSQA
ncbi:sensor histidine kinase [Dictyobacter halimunensis]|uniref:sensor histidine kinase n=1 Tax=Dictyobacter halimunensis TaxID=3026934 RepID=UPI0030C662DF